MVNFSCILASILTANSYISLLQLKSTHKMFFFILYYAIGSIWLHYFQYEFQVHSVSLGRETRMKRNIFVVDFTWSKEIKNVYVKWCHANNKWINCNLTYLVNDTLQLIRLNPTSEEVPWPHLHIRLWRWHWRCSYHQMWSSGWIFPHYLMVYQTLYICNISILSHNSYNHEKII